MPDGRTMRLYRILPPYNFIKEYYALQPDEAEAMVSEIRAERKKLTGSHAEPYDGAEETISALKRQGIRLYAVSPYPVGEARAILANTGLEQYMDCVYQKPERGSVLQLLASGAKLNMEEILYVGDSVDDMDEAEKAGCTFLPSTYGYGFERVSRAKFPVPVLDDIRKLPALLEKHAV